MILLMEIILPCISGVVESTAISCIHVLKQQEQKELNEERQSLQKEGFPQVKSVPTLKLLFPPLLVFYFEDGFCMTKNLNTQ